MGTSGKTRGSRRFHYTGCLLKVIGCRRAPRIKPIERKKPITHKRAVDFTVLHNQNKHHNTVLVQGECKLTVLESRYLQKTCKDYRYLSLVVFYYFLYDTHFLKKQI